ncbi:uncharacterized protein LOC123296531 [Chrysoperla carnea]|uniref:uncharacterized protein LOC123296531 n=1 Tax=Chrysoperla carnea TaxID=189513 RepID=UPI001D067F59|nr:uncharacterized protein LOC123296531 [Chrysoperla carnea]
MTEQMSVNDNNVSEHTLNVGQHFNDYEQLSKTVNVFCKEHYHPFVIRTRSQKQVLYKCCHGIKQNSKCLGKRPNQHYYYKNCKAQINFYKSKNEKWKLTKLLLNHNHTVGKEEYSNYGKGKIMNENDYETATDLILSSAKDGMVVAVLSKKSGKQFIRKDIQNFRNKLFPSCIEVDQNHLMEFLAEIEENGGIYAIQKDAEEEVESLFVASSAMVLNYNKSQCPVIQIDVSFGFNVENYKVLGFCYYSSITDKSEFAAIGFIAKETYSAFIHCMNEFKKIFGNTESIMNMDIDDEDTNDVDIDDIDKDEFDGCQKVLSDREKFNTALTVTKNIADILSNYGTTTFNKYMNELKLIEKNARNGVSLFENEYSEPKISSIEFETSNLVEAGSCQDSLMDTYERNVMQTLNVVPQGGSTDMMKKVERALRLIKTVEEAERWMILNKQNIRLFKKMLMLKKENPLRLEANIGLCKSYQRQLHRLRLDLVKQGGGVTKKQNRHLIWETIETHHQGRVKTGMITNLDYKDPNIFFNRAFPMFRRHVRRELVNHPLKVYIMFTGNFIKPTTKEEDLKTFITYRLTCTATKLRFYHSVNCGEKEAVRVRMPETDDERFVEFKDFNSKERVEYMVYADFEALLVPQHHEDMEMDHGSYTKKIQKHVPYSVGYYVHCTHDPNQSFYKAYRGADCVKWFVHELEQVAYSLEQKIKHVKPMYPLTVEQELDFMSAEKCHICGKDFVSNSIRVRDHSHRTGIYRGAAHQFCNLHYQDSRVIPVVMHNLSGYDSHFIIEALLTEIDGQVDVLPINKEKYISFTKHVSDIQLRFIDSFRFLADKLENLASYLDNDKKSILHKEVSNDEQFQLLTRKGVFPYEYMSSWGRLQETKLPPKEAFYSVLTDEHITDEDYNHAIQVWNTFNLHTLGDYSDLYMKTDVLLLADIFENFRNTCIHSYNLDPSHYYTLPGYTWSAMLKYTNIKLELFTDIDDLLFIEKGIRGGVSQCSNRYAKANNKYMEEGYDKTQEDVYLMYYDVVNLYGAAMCGYLPKGNFKWVDTPNIEDVADDSPVGYILETYRKRLCMTSTTTTCTNGTTPQMSGYYTQTPIV